MTEEGVGPGRFESRKVDGVALETDEVSAAASWRISSKTLRPLLSKK